MMRLWITLIMFCVLNTSVLAQEIAENTLNDIAVVDVIQLLRDSKAAQSINEQIQQKREVFQKDISAREKELRAMEEALVNEREGGDVEAFNEKRRTFEKGLRDLQSDTQKKRLELDKASAQAIGKLRAEITKITAEIANEEGYKLVITRDQVIIVTSDIDITQRVLESLNDQFDTIKVEVE